MQAKHCFSFRVTLLRHRLEAHRTARHIGELVRLGAYAIARIMCNPMSEEGVHTEAQWQRSQWHDINLTTRKFYRRRRTNTATHQLMDWKPASSQGMISGIQPVLKSDRDWPFSMFWQYFDNTTILYPVERHEWIYLLLLKCIRTSAQMDYIWLK